MQRVQCQTQVTKRHESTTWIEPKAFKHTSTFRIVINLRDMILQLSLYVYKNIDTDINITIEHYIEGLAVLHCNEL